MDFLNYIQSKCTQEEWFPFQLFEGPGDGDYDTWLNCFYEMRNIWREGKADEALARYRELEETGIYHLTRMSVMLPFWCRRRKGRPGN